MKYFLKKPFTAALALLVTLNFFQASVSFADLVPADVAQRPDGFSIEARVDAAEWEEAPDAAGGGLGAAAQDLWDQATSWAQSALTLSNDPYFNTRTFSSAYDDLWWLKAVQAPAAWGLSTGRGVTVAVVDTGIDYNHEDLAGNVWTNAGEIAGNGIDDDGNGYVDDWRGWDFANNDNNAIDDNGHGTHVAGIIGALKDNDKGIAGIAPDSKILGIKVLDKSGSGTFANIVKGIRYAADLGARIINLSLGAVFDYTLDYIKTNFSSYYNAYLRPIQDAISYAAGRGSVVVAASGNSGVDVNRTAPAGFTETLSVGATTSTGMKASFSNTGATLDLTAPGSDILSLRAAGTSLGTAAGTGYTRMSGTSMATPMVSGVVALLLAQDPTLDIAGIERRLKFSAKDLGGAGFDTSFGFGQVDALNAITHDYYEDGKVKTLWLLAPDAQGMVRYDYDLDGRVVSSISADGKKHGLEYDNAGNKIERYASGRIKSRTDAVTGAVHEYLDEDLDGNGTQRVFRVTERDGSRKEYGYWAGTTTVRTLKFYDKDGKLTRTDSFDKRGRITSTASGADRTDYTYWGLTAAVRTLRVTVGGKLARVDSFDQNGRLTVRTSHEGARSTETQYYLDGKARQVTVRDGSRPVSVVRYYENGVVSYRAAYEKGVLITSDSYDQQGRLRVHLEIKGTLKSETTYYLSGKVRQVSLWQGSQRVSTTQYYETGVISLLVLYQNGRLASQTYYAADGKVLRTKTYKLPAALALLVR